jgi:hypothetical protein
MSTERDMRISDQDRSAAAARLKHAHDEGRLDFAEYDRRLALAYGSVTYGDIDQLFTDLPAGQSAPLALHQTAPVAVPKPKSDGLATAFARMPTALKVLWTIWASVMAINLTVWLLVDVSDPDVPYFWPMWLFVPGAVLLAVTAAVRASRGPDGGTADRPE